MQNTPRSFTLKLMKLCLIALLGATVWTLAVVAAEHYATPTLGLGKFIKDYATPFSAVIALLTFCLSQTHQQRSLRRDSERLMLETAVSLLGKALDLAEIVFEKNKPPFFYAAPSFQINTIASLLEAAAAQGLKISESELLDRFKTETSLAGAKLLALLRFRGTADFFDFRYYKAVLPESSFNDNNMVNIAAYHNKMIKQIDSSLEKIENLGTSDQTKSDIRLLQQLINQVRDGKDSPFSHPFFGSSVPLDSMESILRFAVGKTESKYELGELLDGDKVGDQWFLNGLYILLYQSKYFRAKQDATVFNTRNNAQIA